MCGGKEKLDEVEDEDESKERRGGVAVIHSSTAQEENLFTHSDLRTVSGWKRINGVLTHANSRVGLELLKRFLFLPLLPWQPGATPCARMFCTGYVLNTKI